ncbi:hypothetical protein THITH_13700 [Thioalkalivibrio paradoxus ARh 1]|uniref:Uncharacterized protein n=1 Tax=Thioalkalivibrio paradoxus ARh 1 TaxID=713585 RepID=W0DSL4_9GAMM|nr:hypothetical protein THITH_13700 [Thioalkalivibrio paradoxus ARh 1]
MRTRTGPIDTADERDRRGSNSGRVDPERQPSGAAQTDGSHVAGAPEPVVTMKRGTVEKVPLALERPRGRHEPSPQR